MLETMSTNKNINNSVTVDINPNFTTENAPLAMQESLEEEEEEEEDVNISSDKFHNVTNGSVVVELEDELQQIVVADVDPEWEVSSLHNSVIVEHCPSVEPIMIEHKVQVLQDGSVLEKELGELETSQEDNFSRTESENFSEINQLFNASDCTVDKKLSEDLMITVESCPNQQLKVTEKLPEVLLVAEQLPVRLKAAKNILRLSSKEKEPTAPPYESLELEDGGSNLTIGRPHTATEPAGLLGTETGKVPSIEDRVDFKARPVTSASNNESCISPFFIGIYSFLGVLIVIMIGLNFLFGFHLLFFLGLLAVIALFSCVLTEFNDFHNEPD